MKTRFLLPLLAGLLALPAAGIAVTVATPPAGYARIAAGGGRDNWLSLPLVRRAEFIGRVASIGPATLTFSGPAWPADAYAPAATGAYYAQFVTGNLAGMTYKVLGNTANQLTLATAGDDLGVHGLGPIVTGTAGDLVRLRPYWTIADVFGHEIGDLRLAPVAALAPVLYTEGDALLLPDNQSPGTEKLPAATIAFVTGQGWRRSDQSAVDAGATGLPPGVPFVWRRPGVATSAFVVGYVAPEPGVIRLPALPAGGETDVSVALFSPWLRTLAGSGLADAIESSTDADHARDLLLSPADLRRGFSIPPARRLHRVGTDWFEGVTAANEQTLRPTTGFLIRLRGERPVRYWRQPALP